MLEMLAAFDAGFGGEVGHLFKGCNEFRPAIGIAGVVERIDAEKNVACAQHLGPGQRKGEKDGVARGHIGDGNAVRTFLRRRGLWERQCRP